MEIEQYKNEYLQYLEVEKNRSTSTIANYRIYLERFIAATKVQSVADITEPAIREYRLGLSQINLKKITQNYCVVIVRNFLKYLEWRGIPCLNSNRIQLAKQEQRKVDFLEPEEVARLVCQPDNARDRAILTVLYSTGLRISELAALNRDDVLKREVVIRGKGGKVRTVFLSDEARRRLSMYLSERDDDDNNPALFINRSVRLPIRSIQTMVKRAAKQAGIEKKVSAHTIRHSFATGLLRNGADIRVVQEMLGHSSITTTTIYTHVANAQMREAHEKYHDK